ncbi:MAG: glutamine synthetase family protein [Gammaproteobacteria bacterium]|nr:glutamine synthetase family protein [Gammaproteobacteria bacterium]
MSSHSTPMLDQYLKRYPQTKYLDAYISDLSCIIRGKRYPIEEAGKLFHNGMMLPGSTFLLTICGDSRDPENLGYSDGDPDEIAIPIVETLSPCAWTELPTAQMMLTLTGLDGTPYYYEPRNVLRRVLDQFDSLGLRPVVAFEPEFYLLQPDMDDETGPEPAHLPSTGRQPTSTQVYSIDEVEEFSSYFDQVVSACKDQNIRISAISKEYSPAQFELNLHHVDDALLAADQYVMLRRASQGFARRHNMRATYMAKPFPEQSGSGLHVHISLLDQNGMNVFAGCGQYGEIDSITDLMRHSLGGILQTMSESMGIYAPNVNAYRRFKPDCYAPIHDNWGFENRLVALRIPKSDPHARRIEHRIAGADANPYLLLATILAGIHYGIQQKIEPGPPTIGDTIPSHSNTIPTEIVQAMNITQKSQFLANYFGKHYVKVYTVCKLEEYNIFKSLKVQDFVWYV